MSEEWLIKGAAIPGGEPADIHLKDGVVARIGRDLDAPGASVLDAAGLIALPGLVDLHTHLREPGREDAETVETGTRAAALGGYTAVHAMANTEPVADTAGVVEQIWRLGPRARGAGGSASRPGTPTSARSARSPWAGTAGSSRSSARWLTRPRRSGCSPTTATA